MANVSYLVVRIHPDTPVDSGTFGTYLDGLQIQVYPADAPQIPANLLGQVPPIAGLSYVPVVLIQVPWIANTYVTAVTKVISSSTPPQSSTDFGKELDVESNGGIAFGATVVCPSNTSLFGGNSTVTSIAKTSVELSQTISSFVAAGTIVTFFYEYGPGVLTIGANDESFSFQQNTSAAANNAATVKFVNTNGVAPGMVPNSGSAFPAGTQVLTVTATSITFSNPVTLAKNAAVTFTCELNSGIVQHVEQLAFDAIITTVYIPIPASVATAVIPLTNSPAPNTYLDISVVATRDGVPIPVNSDFYNVIYITDTQLPTPNLYQSIDLSKTSLYLTLPAPPLSKAIGLVIPSDGSAPEFTALFGAMQQAVQFDPYFTPAPDLTQLSTDQCTRMAYDIVWSQQNALPLPSDPLEELYTNPPNTGGTGGSSSNSNNGDEQDRQKFEGTLNSFYSTRNATAVRLTKFVAAASGALYCEKKSVGASQALLEFPVDPASFLAPSPVESEVLLTGLSATGVNFGVPAPFFYALGTNMDKTTTGDVRYQMATGDTAERILQEFGQAVSAGVIEDTGSFSALVPPQPAASINSAQAARRLSALGVTSASTSPVISLSASVDLGNLVSAWLGATTLTPTYTTYLPAYDNIIWALMLVNPVPPLPPPLTPADFAVTAQPTEAGFLQLVLGALTQGYLIPNSGPPLVPLATKIAAWLPSTTNPPTANPTVETLKAVTAAQWTQFFTPNPSWLPAFVQPTTPVQTGYVAACVKAFVRAAQKFFTVSSVVNQAPTLTPGAPAAFAFPSFDAIGTAASGLPSFDMPMTAAQIAAAVQGVFSPGTNAKAQAWLLQAVTTLNQLSQIASVVPAILPPESPTPASLAFSVMEALYARGFRTAKDITILSPAAFQQALIGTVAYAYAGTAATGLYGAAAMITPSPAPSNPPPSGSFEPINPDGSLTDCIPPPCISPLGPAAYLQEMLQVHEDAACGATGPDSAPTLASAISTRRGPLGNLLASPANVETALPLIDIVNECLENVAATAPGTVVGAVNNTTLPEDSAKLLAAEPQWSSPATPVQQPAAYANLANDFSAPCLPYAQPLDISRSYQRLLCACRAETMRAFRKEITEFVLAPANPPADFEDYLWRYPVRIEIAVEYLGLTPQEFTALFAGNGILPANLSPWQLYGFTSNADGEIPWTTVIAQLSQFLQRTGLSYCEFLELQRSGVAPITNSDPAASDGKFPDCEPCCLDRIVINFGAQDPTASLILMAAFIRLWRAIRHACGGGFSFAQLADITSVLSPLTGGPLTADFIRQLAALQMLRDHFELPLCDPAEKPGGTGANRTHLLALWVGKTAAKWNWAVAQLLDRIQQFSRTHHKAACRAPEFVKLLVENLDPLSLLAGFNPEVATDTWHSRPACTLRFAEVLAKIYASDFSIGDILFLVTAERHLDGEDVFPLEESNEALDSPLGLPDDEHPLSLFALRRRLLAVKVSDHVSNAWNWARINTVLRHEFGYEPDASSDPLLSLGQHLFPNQLAASGIPVSVKDRRYYYANPVATPPLMWNVPPDGPFQCDTGSNPAEVQMWTELPLRDEAVILKLGHVRSLSAAEQTAVQDLYFQPRVDLGTFAFLFPDFADADRHLIQEPDEAKRWAYFARHFALTYARCHIVADHLSRHVHQVTGGHNGGHECAAAWLVLRNLFADENSAVAPASWSDPSGKPPAVTWNPRPNGSAFAALLGLTGTGLLGEFSTSNGQVVWREVRGPLNGLREARNRNNAPAPTIVPAMNYAAPDDQLRFVSVHNGFALRDDDGSDLGGMQGFSARWSGVLLIEADGRYEFQAAAECADDDRRSWRVILKRGQKTWLLLSHHWPEEHGEPVGTLPLKRGAHQIVVEFRQLPPDFSKPGDIRHQNTGIELKYCGPDSGGRSIAIPLNRLFIEKKDGTLWQGIAAQENAAPAYQAFLKTLYTSSLRDMRRTYQRAFKALLLANRFQLSAKPAADDGHTELGYMLAHRQRFAGAGFARSGSTFTSNRIDFDFNFLPLKDDYLPPPASEDPRVKPSPDRICALFDCWERLFDYTRVRREARPDRDRPVWLLFDEAKSKQPAQPGFLLRHLGIDSRHTELLLNYYAGPTPGSLYTLTASDLEDDRWVVRIWHGEEWIRRVLLCFCPDDIGKARPALWAADDPSVPVPPGTESGNRNLTCFVDGTGRYGDIKRVNDALRERARDALVAYLCGMNRVPLADGSGGFAQAAGDLNDYLLLDVESGICEKASRIDEAITAVQNFVRRARLGLEPSWTVTRDFALLWDRRFATFRIWQACKRRELYKENWIEWDELERARRVEAFRFLESELRDATLTIAQPGGGEWWPSQCPPAHNGLGTLQAMVPSSLEQLPFPPTPPTPEGWTLLGTPESDGRTSWLAAPSLTGVAAPTQPPPQPAQTFANLPSATTGPAALATQAAEAALPPNLPFWIESAIRLGAQFVRVAAAGQAAASAGYVPDPSCHEGCCVECGRIHAPMIDEYYFWLIDAEVFVRPDQAAGVALPADTTPGTFQSGIQDSYYDPGQQQSIAWNDTTQLPPLLNWPANPAVRLAWCRVHNGEFGQPRRSIECVQVMPAVIPNLQFLGRARDSLYFSVQGAAAAPSGVTDTSQPGFRYDLPVDDAVALPLAVPAVAMTLPDLPGGLPAYPFFAFNTPGASLFPASLFAPALLVADALRTRCRFDLALKWYELTFAPLQNDCTWIECPSTGQSGSGQVQGGGTNTGAGDARAQAAATGAPPAGVPGTREVANPPALPGACCDSTAVSCQEIRQRAVTLSYCQTLFDWGDHIMRRRPAPEAFQQARLIFDTIARIMGQRPRTILLPPPASPQPVAAFTPAIPPLNPRLLDLYDHTADRLGLIHHCVDARRLRNGHLGCDMPYFGDNPLREGWRTTAATCVDENEWCLPHSPYRFLFLIQKALEFASGVREFGAAFLSSCEKGDAEYLASLHAANERELFQLSLAIRQDQWREADWQIQALQQTKDLDQANLIYYSNLYQNGLINDEIQHQVLATTAMQTRSGANAVEAVGEAMKIIPDLYLGFPCTDTQIPIGTKLAGVFETIGKVMGIFADIQSSTSALDLTLAGWQRRSDEWLHQTQTLPIEIQQVELQILGAQRRRAEALHELNNLQRQFEQSTETLNFLRDKFTGDKLYLWLQKETSALYRKMYELALHGARQAERAFNFERGHTTRRFIPDCTWDTLHDGLLAGERLEFALRRMEKAYLDENIREHELTKHFSLRQQFPGAYLRLRTTGYCEIDIPEWMFDLDYPGHYMRRIRNVTLTLPCVTGPYTGVHCRLTLLSSMTRIDPSIRPPAEHCCCDRQDRSGYEACPDDPRVVRQYAARESIATSSGQNDSGMFELNFRDDRYLPFEYLGAVCRVRIELPPENNYFDLESLTDAVLHMNYTSREGGPLLRRAASESAQGRLPGDGWCFFDARSDFPDAWQLFRDSSREKARQLELRFRRNLFPFIPGRPELFVSEFVLVFETDDAGHRGCTPIEFHRGGGECEEIRCVSAEKWPGLRHGSIRSKLGPIGARADGNRVTFRFPADCGKIGRVFVFCKYETVPREPEDLCCGSHHASYAGR